MLIKISENTYVNGDAIMCITEADNTILVTLTNGEVYKSNIHMEEWWTKYRNFIWTSGFHEHNVIFDLNLVQVVIIRFNHLQVIFNGGTQVTLATSALEIIEEHMETVCVKNVQ